MARTITIEVSDEMEEAMSQALSRYRKQVNESAVLTSLLYDIDLLPEQIKLPVNVSRMIAVCEMFKRLTADQVQDLMREST